MLSLIPVETFDGLTDEEDIDDEQLYGDESLEIDMKNDSEGAPNMECIGNILLSKLLANDTPSTSTFNHKCRRILSLQNKYTENSLSSVKDVPLQFPSPRWKTVKKDANLPFATSNLTNWWKILKKIDEQIGIGHIFIVF